MLPRLVVLALVSLGIAGCPGHENSSPADGGVGDAGLVTDAGLVEDSGLPDAGRELDYRAERGAPYTTVTAGDFDGRPFGLTSDTFSLEQCDAGACDYEWRSHDAGLLDRVSGLQPVFGTLVSRDGQRASLMRVDRRDACTDALGTPHEYVTGEWRMFDVASGQTLASEPALTTLEITDPAFLRSGLNARLVRANLATCDVDALLLRSTVAPFAVPAAHARMTPTVWLIDELADGRLVADEMPARVTVLDPRDAGSDVHVSLQATSTLVSDEHVHSFEGAQVRVVASYDAEQRRVYRTELPWQQRDHTVLTASGRWFVVCRGLNAMGHTCEVRDGRGEHALATVTATIRQGRTQLAVAGRGGFVVYLAGDHVVRRSLVSGEETTVVGEVASPRGVAGGRGVLVTTAMQRAWLVEANRVTELSGRLEGLVDVGGDLPQSQTVLFVLGNPPGGSVSLVAWHAPSGRLAKLSDTLNFNPPFQAPLTAAEACNAPGFARTAGRPFESASVASRWVHFTEHIPGAPSVLRLFVLPVDLSSAPRLLAEVGPEQCGAPLMLLDGGRALVPSPRADGKTRVLIASP
ncbi:MAG: hypothetical protein JNK82_03130 [Myxococcaceae bacterium]|nr:hypothetical protein [Myxococcaceae bacterium]